MNFQGEATLQLSGQTRQFDDQVLSAVTLWSAEGQGLRHWRTAFTFARLPKIGVATYEGISVDMRQPLVHERYNPQRDGPANLYGALRIEPRQKKALFSGRPGMFSCVIPFKKAVRVKDVVNLILAQGRQYYMFNPKGSGCLFWHFQLLEAFVANGWVERASLDTAYVRISGFASTPGREGTVPYPPVQGIFYGP